MTRILLIAAVIALCLGVVVYLLTDSKHAALLIGALVIGAGMYSVMDYIDPGPWDFVGRGALRSWVFLAIVTVIVSLFGAALASGSSLGLLGFVIWTGLAGFLFYLGFEHVSIGVLDLVANLVNGNWTSVLWVTICLFCGVCIYVGILEWGTP